MNTISIIRQEREYILKIFKFKIQNDIQRTNGLIIQPARFGCYWQTVPPQWEGGRLFDTSAGFFYGNSCNSGTESRKIVPKVGN